MNEGMAVTWKQAVWILFKLAWRRSANRWQSLRLARKRSISSQPLKRTGTAGKSTVSWVYPMFFFAIFAINGVTFASRALVQLAYSVTGLSAESGLVLVNRACYQQLLAVERYDGSMNQLPDPVNRELARKKMEDWLDRIFSTEVSREGLANEHPLDRLAYLKSVFAEKGSDGFAVDSPVGYMGAADWPKVGREATYIKCLGLLTGLFVLTTVMLFLGLANKDLGQVEWSLEWLYTLPTSPRALYFSKFVSISLLNPVAWMFLVPFLLYAFLASAWSWGSLFLAMVVAVYLMLLGGALAMVIEVGARKFLSRGGLKNLQAVCTIFGSVFPLLYFACGSSRAIADSYVHITAPLPGAFLWQPLSVPAVLMARYAPLWQTGLGLASLLVWSAAALFGSIGLCEWMTRDGLVGAGGPYEGVRKRKAASGRSHARWLAGMPGKELRLVLRDRNILVQVLITPLIIVIFYLVTNSSLVSAARSNFHHAATLAFCVGAYGLLSSAMQILNHEKGALWQLFVFPRSLLSILAEKTVVWACFAFLYAAVTLAALTYFSKHLSYSALIDGFLALYGVVLYAFIAAGIGILATNPLEDEPRARMRVDMIYLYMLLMAMYAYVIYAPSYWSKLGQLVLSTLLAFALWQKAKDRLPFLLDPEASPHPTISVSDGLIAVLAFFVMQGLAALLFSQIEMPMAVRLTLAYGIAGFCVSALTLYALWRHKVPELWTYLGFVAARRLSTLQYLGKSLVYGLVGGGLAAVGAAVYLHVISLVPSWETWKEDAESQSLLSRNDHSLWLIALAVIAAPLCEEFIFRGLLYRGLRRSLHPAFAILASAALFALVHPAVAVIPVFGLGLATAICFERVGLLLAPIVAHITYNACVLFF